MEREDTPPPVGRAIRGDRVVRFVVRLLVNAAAIYLVAAVVPGIDLRHVWAALVGALVLGLVNALVRPILVILTLPITLVTLGLFLFVLNALCLWLTAALVPGFEIRGFGPAFLGALLISAVSWALTAFLGGRLGILRRW
jgi:putative membrane protein